MGQTGTNERYPCTFTPAGADADFCGHTSALLRNKERCQGCASPWRVCCSCVADQKVHPTKSLVVDAETGYCTHHAKKTSPEVAFESDRDKETALLVNSGDSIITIPLTQVRPRSDQPRRYFNEAELDNLAVGLKKVGQQQPVVVVSIPTDDNGCQYELDDGERRWRACAIAGIKTIKCTVIPEHVDDGLRYLRSAVANFNRADHTLLEEVDMVVRLHEEEGFSQKVIADSLGKHHMWVNQRYSLRRLHASVRAMLEPDAPQDKRLSFSAALRLAVLDPEIQVAIAPSLVRANQAELTHVINSAARAAGVKIERRTRAPKDDFRSILRNVKTAAERLRLLSEMDEADWNNAFRTQNQESLAKLNDLNDRLTAYYTCAKQRLVDSVGEK